ncbi:MAG: carboxypeptidase-like regulatory domain-containing protein [Bacteroidetes bacterium]|nr:carboxypeptidase-like regulatory domain-containing protein [Bacteroidota bacterium]
MRKFHIIYMIFMFLGFCSMAQNKDQQQPSVIPDKFIQISGVVVENDSLKPVPFVSIMVKGTKHGTVSDYYGFFTIVASPGDELQFFSVTHKNATYQLPDTLTGKHYSIIRVLTRDTVELAQVSVFPWPSKEDFKRAILNLDLTDTDLDRAAKNMDNEDLRASMNGLSMDAASNYRMKMQQQYTKLYQAGQYPSISLLNPIAWAQFIDAWRKGKFKQQTPKK